MIIAVGFLVAAACGAIARAIIGARLNDPNGMAWGTLTINITGSFALGLLAGSAPELATIFGTGLLGAYTTFSSFARDVASALERKQYAISITYVLASVCGGVGAAWLALALRGAA